MPGCRPQHNRNQPVVHFRPWEWSSTWCQGNRLFRGRLRGSIWRPGRSTQAGFHSARTTQRHQLQCLYFCLNAKDVHKKRKEKHPFAPFVCSVSFRGCAQGPLCCHKGRRYLTDTSPRLVATIPARWLFHLLRPPISCLVCISCQTCTSSNKASVLAGTGHLFRSL